jgi:voltage-gated potassium channel
MTGGLYSLAMNGPDPIRRDWRAALHEIIFEADTPSGKTFDIALLVIIILSVIVVMLDSVVPIKRDHGRALLAAEWVFTSLFTLEYVLRLACVRRPSRYATSFFGVVDLIAIVPTYLSLFLPGAQSLLVVRALRLVRVFRVFKLARYVGESRTLMTAMRASRPKITVFLLAVVVLVINIGALMYLIEGADAGFTSIPQSVYWAIVTMTTVGYGDVAPQSVIGKVFASVVMITGYGIIAVPTGIVTAELADARRRVSTQACPSCSAEGHDVDARHCKACGVKL